MKTIIIVILILILVLWQLCRRSAKNKSVLRTITLFDAEGKAVRLENGSLAGTEIWRSESGCQRIVYGSIPRQFFVQLRIDKTRTDWLSARTLGNLNELREYLLGHS